MQNTQVMKRSAMGKTRILAAEERLIVTVMDSLPKEMIEALENPNTLDVYLNPDKKVFCNSFTGKKHICNMEKGAAEEVIRTVAGMHGKVITLDNPLLECEWPLDGSRFTAQLPPTVAGPTWAIRKRAIKVFTLEEYVTSGIMAPIQCEAICKAVADHRNIVVVGGTGSGKTTLTNAIIHQITVSEPDTRQIIIEDTGEIQSLAEDRVNYHTTLTTTLTDLIKTTLRMGPDRVIVGEIRGHEAFDLLQIFNSGHPGGCVTVHANDCESGLNRLKALVSMHPYAPREIEPDIALAIDVLVNIVKRGDGRVVKEIVEVCGFSRQRVENNGYELRPIA